MILRGLSRSAPISELLIGSIGTAARAGPKIASATLIDRDALASGSHEPRMHKCIRLFSLVVLFVLGVAPSARANGTVNNVLIQSLRVDFDGRGIVVFSAPLGGLPAACTTAGYESALAFDTTSAAGKAVFSLLLAAKLSGARLDVRGSGGCTVYGGVLEDWAWGRML